LRTKLKDRILPQYTKGEEIFNAVSHIIGGFLGIAITVLCIVFSSIKHNVYAVVSSSIYGSSMIILYTMSSIYHSLKVNTAKKVFQIIDHCSIYLLIAGTYTPFSLCTLREYNTALGWSVFGVVWGLAVLGIILNAIDLRSFRVISMILYLVMGWCIVFSIRIVFIQLGSIGFTLLLTGGISYTVGAILYGIGSKRKYFHSVFHVFVVIGSILHFFCILFFIILK
jgi:hemolysin III